MRYLSISHSKTSVTLTDEGLVKFYHFISQYHGLFFWRKWFVRLSLLPSLKNEKAEKKIILLYALTARLPSGCSPSTAILEHITPEHNAFFIRQSLIKLKEMEQNIFRKPNCGLKHVLVNYSKSMIKAILCEFSGESLFQYLDRAYK